MHEVLIIGGGPAGLTAGMFCRMRRMSVQVIDAGRLGGQLVSLYGDKPVHDWPGFIDILGRDLSANLVNHAKQLEVERIEQTKVLDLVRHDDGHFTLLCEHTPSREERRFEGQAVIVAIGGGAFEPRRLRVPGEEGLEEDQLTYRMAEKSRIAGRHVVVVGGGDSGLESAQAAHEAGARVTLVQVLDRLTGMETNIDKVRDYGVPMHLQTRVQEVLRDGDRIRGVRVQTKGAAGPVELPCDYVVVNIGASVNLDAVRRWGLEIENNLIKVDGHMRSTIPGVLACGDIVTYDGKYKLLITAAKEGAVAANSAYVHVRKPARVTMGDLYT